MITPVSATPRLHLPGVDFIRFTAASAVVFSHSFLIAEGHEENEPFQMATGEILGVYSVLIFFIVSGMLISESAQRSSSLFSFLEKRIRRIFPAFILSNLVLVVLVAPFFAKHGAAAFLSERNTWSFLAKVLMFWENTLFFSRIELYPPASASDWMPKILNGVLWTIRQEFTCYLLVALMMVLRVGSRPAVLICAGLAVLLLTLPGVQARWYTAELSKVLPAFVVGMALQLVARQHRARAPAAALSLGLLATLALTVPSWPDHHWVLFPLLAGYPLLWLGQRDYTLFRTMRRAGDPSYGIYLWGWPIQQLIRAAIGPGHDGYTLAALALPLAIIAGYASWHAIERPALRGRWPRRTKPQRVGTGSSPR